MHLYCCCFFLPPLFRLEKGSAPLVSVAAHMTKSICYQNKDALMAGIIIAGWDKSKGAQVYSIPLGGTLVEQDVAIGGSGSTFIYGLIDAEYKNDMTAEQCLAFVRKAISHAMARDGSSGGVIRTAVITEAGVERGFVPGDALPFAFLADTE